MDSFDGINTCTSYTPATDGSGKRISPFEFILDPNFSINNRSICSALRCSIILPFGTDSNVEIIMRKKNSPH